MRVTILGSGSSGNSILLQSGVFSAIVDAGFSAKETERRLRSLGCDPANVQAIVVTHEHIDHIRGSDVLSRRYTIPVFVSEGTSEAEFFQTKEFYALERFKVGTTFEIVNFRFNPFTIAHDALDPSAFVIESAGHKIGIGTDLGYVTNLVRTKFTGLDMLMLESNYDLAMLQNGPYPWHVKQRVASRNGHLSNMDMAEFVLSHINDSTRHLVLAHLSETNNRPKLALDMCRDALVSASNDMTKTYVASQHKVCRPISLEEE